MWKTYKENTLQASEENSLPCQEQTCLVWLCFLYRYEENRRNLARYRLRPEEVEKIARHDELAAELASLKAHLKDAQVKLLLKKVHSLEQQLWFLKGQCKCSANSENGPLSVQHQENEKWAPADLKIVTWYHLSNIGAPCKK